MVFLGRSDYASSPRTPTPFKNALAELERRSGVTAQLPATPSRLDALAEIIKQETDREGLTSKNTTTLLQDSGYGAMKRRGKENSAPSGRKARKALCQTWSTSQDSSEISFAVETPVCIISKFLLAVSDNSDGILDNREHRTDPALAS
ncbi:hypothetical protein QAD02_013996 [Eretmocerus hayati]|uniref:Uncharacterized protein n=1 Tax=Eretmocerus hayati TaxID=131215 RepID=A0ACC2P4G3_9HYME|nr:hypothetical protein QAD02_013996 [Eretmocerus hayati]